jgi:hypothetical protein
MVTITKTGTGQAVVEVNGQRFPARFDSTNKRWIVATPSGDRMTTSPKLKSIGRLFGQGAPQVSGQTRSRTPRGPSRTRGTRSGPAFSAPKPTAATVTVEALAKLEDALVVVAAERGVTPQLEKQFERYQKLKAHALGRGTTGPEAQTAMRLALIEAVKLVF